MGGVVGTSLDVEAHAPRRVACRRARSASRQVEDRRDGDTVILATRDAEDSGFKPLGRIRREAARVVKMLVRQNVEGCLKVLAVETPKR